MKNNEPPQEQIKVDLSSQADISCDECGSLRFQHGAFYLKRLSPIISPTGKEETVPIGPLFSCEECGHINDEFVPPALMGRRKGDRVLLEAPPEPTFESQRPTFTIIK